MIMTILSRNYFFLSLFFFKSLKTGWVPHPHQEDLKDNDRSWMCKVLMEE